MNDPNNLPAIDFDEMVVWLREYRARTGLAWPALASQSGIPYGTITQMRSPSYKGSRENGAKLLYRFKQKVESQEARSHTALAARAFIETPSARRVQFLLEVAHMGRMTLAAMGPGTGKTMTALHYKASVANVWLATMRQSTGNLAAMIDQVMRAMALDVKSGWTRQRSDMVAGYVTNRQGLIVIDEANHLEWAALEELRGWHDATGVGVALLGNEELQMRIKGGSNRHAYARLNSRIGQSHIQDMPTEADVTAFLEAVEIDDGATIRLMSKVALSPGSGGLRELQQILESANMLAIGDDAALSIEHIEAAMKSRATSQMRRAA